MFALISQNRSPT